MIWGSQTGMSICSCPIVAEEITFEWWLAVDVDWMFIRTVVETIKAEVIKDGGGMLMKFINLTVCIFDH